MHFRAIQALLFGAAILIALQVAACTIIGTLSGLAASTQDKTVEGWEVQEIKAGRQIRLHMKSDSTIETFFYGTYLIPASRYAEVYSNWLHDDPARLGFPEYGAEVTVSSSAGKPAAGKFAGVDVNRLYLFTGRGLKGVMLSDVVALSGESGSTVTSEQITEDVVNGGVPLRRLYRFGKDKNTVVIDPREIQDIYVYGHNYVVTGLLVGVAIDAIIIAFAAASWENESYGSSSSEGSCPFVYSFDGDGYTLDAEPLGGAWFQAAQRTDFIRLDYARESDGLYRMRVATELDETDYIDALKLIAVDHPPGAEIAPSFEGRMLVLSDPVLPTKAYGFDGADVLDHILRRNDDRWTSNPFRRNLNDPDQLRDGLTVEFPRPPGSDSVTIAVTAQNTPWTAHLGTKYLSLHGEDLESWYETMNGPTEARKDFGAALLREVLLAVEVWNGKRWRRAGTVWGIGPAVEAERGMRIGLADVPGNTLRVRFSSTAGLWMIDRVVADYSAHSPNAQIVPRMITANDESGADVIQQVSEIDAIYHTMPKTGSRVDLTFEAPDIPTGLHRTLVFATTGYYKPHLDLQGSPEPDLTRRIATVPGAFGQWALGELYRDLENTLAAR